MHIISRRAAGCPSRHAGPPCRLSAPPQTKIRHRQKDKFGTAKTYTEFGTAKKWQFSAAFRNDFCYVAQGICIFRHRQISALHDFWFCGIAIFFRVHRSFGYVATRCANHDDGLLDVCLHWGHTCYLHACFLPCLCQVPAWGLAKSDCNI